MSEQEIKKIIAELDNTLGKYAIADYYDVLNALTDILLRILKDSEFISTREAYFRVVEVFKAAAAKADDRKPPRIRRLTRYEQFQKRQQRVAERAAKAAQKVVQS